MSLRPLSAPIRADLLLGSSLYPVIPYIRITAPNITGGVAYVGDAVDHVIDGRTYRAIGIGIAPPVENDDLLPKMTLTLPDVDRRLGAALRASRRRAFVSLDWYHMSVFDLTVTPRAPMPGATPLVTIRDRLVVEVTSAGGGSISLVLMRPNLDREPFPQLRATLAVAPGLHK